MSARRAWRWSRSGSAFSKSEETVAPAPWFPNADRLESGPRGSRALEGSLSSHEEVFCFGLALCSLSAGFGALSPVESGRISMRVTSFERLGERLGRFINTATAEPTAIPPQIAGAPDPSSGPAAMNNTALPAKAPRATPTVSAACLALLAKFTLFTLRSRTSIREMASLAISLCPFGYSERLLTHKTIDDSFTLLTRPFTRAPSESWSVTFFPPITFFNSLQRTCRRFSGSDPSMLPLIARNAATKPTSRRHFIIMTSRFHFPHQSTCP